MAIAIQAIANVYFWPSLNGPTATPHVATALRTTC